MTKSKFIRNIEKRTDPNLVDSDGWTPLHNAAWCGHAGVAKVLIAKGADPNAKKSEWMPLRNHAGVMRVADSNRMGWTPLHNAAWCGHAGVAKVLVAKGADPNAKSNSGRTPLGLAEERGNYAVQNVLLKAGAGAGKALDLLDLVAVVFWIGLLALLAVHFLGV